MQTGRSIGLEGDPRGVREPRHRPLGGSDCAGASCVTTPLGVGALQAARRVAARRSSVTPLGAGAGGGSRRTTARAAGASWWCAPTRCWALQQRVAPGTSL